MIIKHGCSYEHDISDLKYVGEAKTIKEAFSMITKDLKKRKYKYYYLISTLTPDYMRIDYGSWSQFYYIDSLPDNAKEQWDSYCGECSNVWQKFTSKLELAEYITKEKEYKRCVI